MGRPGIAQPRIGRQLGGLFAAEVISTTGTEMTAVALPWFVLVTTGSPARMGVVLAAEFAGMSVLGLWGGRLATALGSRRMMLASDLVRAALIGLIPALHWAGLLSLPVIVAVGFAVGAFFPAYTASQRLVLAGIVGDDELRLTRVGGLMGSVNETASFVGPALGGTLVALIGAANVLVVDAASYLCAFLLVGTFVPATNAAGDDESPAGVLAGFRYLFGNRGLRRQVFGIGLVEVAFTAMLATLPVLALHHGGASVAGWLLACYGAGSVAGGLISARARRAGRGVATWAAVGIAGSAWLLAVPGSIWSIAGAVVATGVCCGLFFPRFFAAVTSATPPALRAQVLTSVTIAISVGGPVGFLGAGALAQHSGSTAASRLLVAIAATLGAVVTVRGLRTPADPAPVPVETASP